MKVNKKNYDFVWEIKNIGYLYTTIWYTKNYQNRDFLILGLRDDVYLYISKKERKNLKERRSFYFKNFIKNYKIINNEIISAKKFFKNVKRKRLEKLNNNELAAEYESLVKMIQKLWEEYFWTEEFIMDFDKDDKINSINFSKIRKLKYKQRECLNETFYSEYVLVKLHNEIARRLKIGKNELDDYSFWQLICLLGGDKKTKKQNHKYFVIGKVLDKKEINGSVAKKIIKIFLDVDNNKDILIGRAGNKGYCKGTVKKIEADSNDVLKREINKMKKGDILVTSSTSPEFILACRKAGAIITDEGGILSHAILVSRELNIPCVIGTKIATRVLKDGDLVEVDADRGIVKIIKK